MKKSCFFHTYFLVLVNFKKKNLEIIIHAVISYVLVYTNTHTQDRVPDSPIFLIAKFMVSAMYIFPLSSTVSPFGWFILASLGLPSTCPVYPSADPATSLGLLSAFN